MYTRIKILRIKYQYSEQQIADYLNISVNKYISYESGNKQIPLIYLSKLAKKFNTSIDYIIEDTDVPIPHAKN